MIILQTLPSVAIGLFTRWFHRGALLTGWTVGMGAGMWMLYAIPNAATKRAHFGGSAFPLSNLGFDTPKTVYVGFIAVVLNLLVTAIVTVILRAAKVADGFDGTIESDYTADEGDPRLESARTNPDELVSST